MTLKFPSTASRQREVALLKRADTGTRRKDDQITENHIIHADRYTCPNCGCDYIDIEEDA